MGRMSSRRLHLPLAEELDGKPILNPKFKETFGTLAEAEQLL